MRQLSLDDECDGGVAELPEEPHDEPLEELPRGSGGGVTGRRAAVCGGGAPLGSSGYSA